MGVVCILTYKVPEGKSGQQTVDLLQKRIEDIGAIKTGNFLVECETYQAVQTTTTQKTVHIIHNSETPATCYAVTDSGVCLSADILFDAIMVKLRDFYSAKKNLRVESKGQRYEIGDFIVKIGSVVIGQNTSFKGILVEVEYLACEMPNECWNLMKEFMTGFMGANLDSPTSHFTKRIENLFMPVDTAQQYLEHFNNFRKATTVQPQR